VPEHRNWLLVSETFTTLQGEGVSTGRLAHFVRLGACDLHCKWCDTPYTWAFSERLAALHESGKQYNAKTELRRVPILELAQQVRDANVPLCVITGGEPLLQLGPVASLISAVNEEAVDRVIAFEFETAGTHDPGELLGFDNVSFNVSPKLASSGNELDLRFRPEVLKYFVASGRARFKFVVDTREAFARDLEEVERIVELCGIPPEQTWLMPCGTTEEEIVDGLQLLAPIAIRRRWNLTGRQHVTIWGSERGH
jgi:7-carboxy-7-deazaguanine synthase